MNEKTFAFYVGGIKPGNIDDVGGIIRDVRIITEGSALGHNVDIDQTTIQQILDACNQYANGVKVKMDHDGGAGDIPGYVTNFRKMSDSTGEYLLGDLHLFATHPQRGYILEMASRIPDTFGLSLFFIGKPEEIEGRMKARCNRVFSCDIVTEPAANPSLFSVGPIVRSTKIETSQVDKKKKNMTPEEFAECMKTYESGKSASTAVVPSKETHEVKSDGSEKHVITKGPVAPVSGDEGEPDKEETMAMRIAGSVMSKLSEQGIRIKPNVSGDAVKLEVKNEDAKPITFERMVNHLVTTGDETGLKFSRGDAIKFVTSRHSDLHEDYLRRAALDYPGQRKQLEMSRAGKEFSFKYQAEHWLVQGTPKPQGN